MPKLIDEISEAIESHRPRRGWLQRVPKNLQSELEEVRAAYHAGALSAGSRTVAQALAKMLERRGHRVTFETIRKWLLKNSPKNSPPNC